jgi:DNA-binding transcriptional MerR regulator
MKQPDQIRTADRTAGHPEHGPGTEVAPPSSPPSPTERAEARLSLADLTRAADVSVRTVRYYIAEGLLPPPVGAGPRSAYTGAHLDRLRLIGRLKESYLPLKEIRRRLAGLPDAEVGRLLAAEPARNEAPSIDSAAAYLDRILGARTRDAPPPSRPTPAIAEVWDAHPPSPPDPAPRFDLGGFSAMASAAPPTSLPADPTPPAPILGRAYPASFAPMPDPEPDEPVPEPDAWRRVRLGDDAELLIRESAYRRRRDRVEWLVAWARRVFG